MRIIVVMFLLFVLAVTILPAFQGSRGTARNASCLSNLKQVALACHLYSQDNNGYLPAFSGKLTDSNQSFYLLMPNYMTTTRPFKCPSDPCVSAAEAMTHAAFNRPKVNSYAYTAGFRVLTLSDSPLAGDIIKDPSKANILKTEQFRHVTACEQAGRLHTQQGKLWNTKGGNVVFVDGHGEFNAGTTLRIRWVDAAGGTANIKNPNGIKDES